MTKNKDHDPRTEQKSKQRQEEEHKRGYGNKKTEGPNRPST